MVREFRHEIELFALAVFFGGVLMLFVCGIAGMVVAFRFVRGQRDCKEGRNEEEQARKKSPATRKEDRRMAIQATLGNFFRHHSVLRAAMIWTQGLHDNLKTQKGSDRNDI